ncbi:hypothetical protein [Tuwongella immobilis]|nr:hypothetical protein [Tuwongella immobilis]
MEGWTIVLAGHWNRMIFSPEWVGKHLFAANGDIETLVALMPVLPLVYRDEQVVMEVSQPRLVFHPRKANDVCLRRAEQMALRILRELDDTPLIAVGVNFAFREENPPDKVLDIFNLTDGPELAGEGWEVQERKIVRKTTRGGSVLNLTLIYGPYGVDFEFNFHTESQDNEDCQAALKDTAVGLKDTALNILDTIYHLQPNCAEGDGR